MTGDIDVIAALGDSLTAASGASSVRVTDLVIENRGLSWSIGGQWSFKNASTLPNILKGTSSIIHYASKNGFMRHRWNIFLAKFTFRIFKYCVFLAIFRVQSTFIGIFNA